MLPNECRKGMIIVFGRPNGEKTRAEVIKCNPSKAKVRTLESRGRRGGAGEVWNVGYSLMTPDTDQSKPALPGGAVLLTLDKFRLNRAMCQETDCFSADVMVDGIRIGQVSNTGTGGPHRYQWLDRRDGIRLATWAQAQPMQFENEKLDQIIDRCRVEGQVLLVGWDKMSQVGETEVVRTTDAQGNTILGGPGKPNLPVTWPAGGMVPAEKLGVAKALLKRALDDQMEWVDDTTQLTPLWQEIAAFLLTK